MDSVASPARPQDFMDEEDLSNRQLMVLPRFAINFEKIRATLIRNRAVILITVTVFVLAAVGITALMRPKFTASASVQIDQQAARVLESQDVDPAASFMDADRFLRTQVDVLKSRSLAERVALALRLDRDNAFVVSMTGKPPKSEPGVQPGTARHEAVIDLLMDNMSVDLPSNSRVATIHFVSPAPIVATEVANAFAQQFIVANLQRKYEATRYARNFVQGRLEDVRRRLEQSERQVNDYARKTGLIDASNAATGTSNGTTNAAIAPRSLALARLVQLNAALVAAQTQRLAAEERWNQARRTSLMSLPEVLSNSAIQELQQQRAQLVAAYEEEKQRRREAYPTMIQQAARISELDAQTARMASDVRRSISDAYQAALSQERETARDLASAEQEARVEQDRGVGYNILRREVDTNRELYDGLLQRVKELSAESGVTTNNISVIDRAEIPRRPTSPKLFLNLAIGLVLGLMSAAAIVLMREMFDDRVRLPEDVPAKLGLPLMGSIPALGPNIVPREALEAPKSELAEAFQALRATLELSTSHGVPGSLLVTSSRPSEGKSTTSYAVARTFARQGRRVVLVDADLRRPSLHKVMGTDNQGGISNLLAGQMTVAEVIRTTEVPNLAFISSGPIPPDPAQLLETEAVRSMLRTLQAECDIVVVDGPPVLGLADAIELASAAEGVLFVVESGSMHFGGVRASLKRLRDVHARLLGVVLNKFNAQAVGYSTNYAYAYTYRYGSAES